MNFLLNETWLSDSVCTHVTLEAFLLVSFCPSSRPTITMAEWICRRKPFWIPVGDTFQKPSLEEWQLVDDGSKRDPVRTIYRRVPTQQNQQNHGGPGAMTPLTNRRRLETPHQHRSLRGKQLENLTRHLGKFPELRRLQLTKNSSVLFLNV